MGSSEIDKENIITATKEELTKEERKAYLLAEEHVKAQFLKGFKKDRGGLIKRADEFVLPSLKLSKDKIEEIPNVSPSRIVPDELLHKKVGLALLFGELLHCSRDDVFLVDL